MTPPEARGGGWLETGRGAVGTGGFPPIFGARGGFAPIGGAGFGFVATGGGGLVAKELDGREPPGLESDDASPLDCGAFFHGVAEPFDGPIPGKTETGFAEASAVTEWIDTFGPPNPALGLGAVCPSEGGGGGRRFAGGGGGGAGAAFGFGGTSSR